MKNVAALLAMFDTCLEMDMNENAALEILLEALDRLEQDALHERGLREDAMAYLSTTPLEDDQIFWRNHFDFQLSYEYWNY